MLGGNTTRAGERRDWDDLGFSVVLKPETLFAETYAAFTVYEILGYGPDGSGDFTVPLFWRTGANSSLDTVDDPSQAEPFMDCTIKWDGCSNWDPAGWHLCGRDDLDNAIEMMRRVWDWAGELGMDRLNDEVSRT